MEAARVKVYHTVPFSSNQLYLQMFNAMSHWFGSKPMASATPSILGLRGDSCWISYCAALCQGDCAAFVLQEWPLYVPQRLTDCYVGVGMSQLNTLDLNLGDT